MEKNNYQITKNKIQISTNNQYSKFQTDKSMGLFESLVLGYYLILVAEKYKGRTIHSYFVPGDGGQIVTVFPELDMVITFTAGNYGTSVKMTCYNMIHRYILPAIL